MLQCAFLHADLDEEIYIRMPEGMDSHNEKGERICLKLLKSIYGLKQSGRQWSIMITEWLLKFGFIQSNVDSCIYIYREKGEVVCIINLYVDDIFTGSNNGFLTRLLSEMEKTFDIKNDGDVKDALGMEITQLAKGSLKISMGNYIEQVLERHSMQDCNSTKVPMDPGFEMHNKDALELTKEEKLNLERTPYINLVGELLWLARCCRPDIYLAVCVLARYSSAFSRRHWNALKHILKYLKGTKDYGLVYTTSKMDISSVLIGYTDSDHAGDKNNRLSTSGGCVFFDKNLISWLSRKQ